jgi:hypothetical protein
MSGSRVLRKISEPKRNEVAGIWRGLYNEEVCGLQINRLGGMC